MAENGIIDLHGHIFLEGSMGAAGWCGPSIGANPDGSPFFQVGNYRLDGVGYRGSIIGDVEVRLAAMDEQGISVQALSPNPLTYLHFIDAHLAIDFCQVHNDELAAQVRAHPDRFVGLGALPMQDVGAACQELRRCVNELGLLGGYIGTDIGRFLDDPTMDELYSTCVELDVPLFMHPTQSGIDGPLRDPRVRRFDLDLVLEYSFEEVLAVSTLVFGGVTTRFPTLDICISHGGGFTPMGMSKLRKIAERRKAAPAWISEPGAFDQAVSRLWFDCHVAGAREFEFALAQLGTEHLVFGTNFGGWDKGTGPDVTDLRGTLNANAIRLTRMDRRAPHIASRFV